MYRTVLYTPNFVTLMTSYDSRRILLAESVELHKYNGIFYHCAERADEPGQVGNDILLLNRVEEDL